jgi:hypothetical protein
MLYQRTTPEKDCPAFRVFDMAGFLVVSINLPAITTFAEDFGGIYPVCSFVD